MQPKFTNVNVQGAGQGRAGRAMRRQEGGARLRNVVECCPMSWRSHGGGAARNGMEQPCGAFLPSEPCLPCPALLPAPRLLLKPSRDNIIAFELLNKLLQLTTHIIRLAFLTAFEHRHYYQQIHDYHIIA